jgi:transposase
MREARSRRYPTDLSDAEWAALEPLLPPPAKTGRPLKWPRRLMAEAIFYLVRSRCAWRMLPTSFPPWQMVFAHFRVGGSTARCGMPTTGFVLAVVADTLPPSRA